MPEKLTLKQKKFIKEYIETGNATEAAMRSYDAKDRLSARNIGSENLAKLGNPIQKVLEKKGLTLESLIDDINEGRKAKKPIVIKDKIAEYPDHATRHRYIDTALKLGDYYPSEKVDIKQDSKVQIEIVENRELVEGETIDDIEIVEDDKEEVQSIL